MPRLTEDHLRLIFEIQSEQADQRYKMEMLDQKVNLLLDICSSPQRPACPGDAKLVVTGVNCHLV
jgi:hypothetical protein